MNEPKDEIFTLMSAVQKCIRRGMEYEALHFAYRLAKISPQALWFRLKVIASEDIGDAKPTLAPTIDTLCKWYFQSKGKLIHLDNAIVILCRSAKSRDADELGILVRRRMNYENERLPLPDWVYDMHTVKGRIMGRGWEHFFNECAQLSNDVGTHRWTEASRESAIRHADIHAQRKRVERKGESKLDVKDLFG